MEAGSKKIKFRIVSIFSLFSISSIILVFACIIVALLGYFGIIDKNGRATFLANEIIANHLGLPLEEIERFEGIKHEEEQGICRK